MISQKVANLSAANRKRKEKGHFFHDMKEEIRKVSWISKNELKICYRIVIGSIFVFGIGIYLVDLFIRLVLDGIENFMQFIGA